MRTPASAVAAAAASVYSEGKIPPILSNQEKWKPNYTSYKFTIITFTITITHIHTTNHYYYLVILRRKKMININLKINKTN